MTHVGLLVFSRVAVDPTLIDLPRRGRIFMINSKHLRASLVGIVTVEESISAAWKQKKSCVKGDDVHVKCRPQCEYIIIGNIQAGKASGSLS